VFDVTREKMAGRCRFLVLLLFMHVLSGSAQNIPCFTGLGCGTGDVGLQVSVRDCCSMADTLAFRPTVGGESCFTCYGFGWVQNISSDLTSAEPQTEITAVEGETVTLTLFYTKNNPPNSLRLDFNIQTSGSATDGVDYVVTPDPASVFMDEVSLQLVPVIVNVTLFTDGIGGEGTEDIVLTLVQLPPFEPERVLVNPTVRIVVEDNDIQTGFRTPGGGCIPEGVLQEICLTTVGSPAVDTVLTVSVTYGTAGPEDFDLLTTQVTITGTMTEPCVSFQAVADGLGLEEVENLTLSLSEPPNVQLTTASLHICIQDSDVVTFEFFGEEAEADEDELEIDVTITRSVATAEEVSFTLTPTEYDASFGFPIAPFDPRSPNLATPGADYVPDVIQFTIPPGDGPTVIPVPIIDDVIAEDSDQYFIGVLGFSGSPTGAVLGRDAILMGIQDNDQATIRFQFLSSAVDEQDVDFTHNLLVTRDVDSEQNYSISLSGSPNTAEDDDFFVSDDTFYFPPDVSSINVSVTIRGDTRIELAETFDVRLRQRGGPNFVVDPLTRLISVGIRDNDGDYIYVPAQSTYTVPEGEQTEVSFVLDNPPPDGVFEFDYNVVLSTADGSATGDSDYISIAGEVIAASTMPNGVVSVNVGVLRDDRVELEETFSVVGRVMESGLIANGTDTELPVVFQSPLNVFIVNQDVVSLRFAAVAVTVTEGGSQLVCLEPVMTDVLDAEFTVQLSLQDGTATGGVDYASEEVTVTIGPPVGSGSPDLMDSTVVCINIDTATDTDIEGAESLTVMGTVINNADLAGFPDGDTVSITILDTSVVLGVEQIMYEVSEADGSLEVCAVVNNGTVVNPVTISVSLSSVSATEGDDYVLEDEVVTLDAGSSVGCATIRIVSDDLIEGPEDFNVEITTDDAFAVISNGFALVTITGELAMIEFDQATYTVMEGDLNPTVDVCVTVGNGRVANSLTVSINVLPTSTATEGGDFELSDPAEIVIPANMARSCLTVTILKSEVVEGEEEIRLAIDSTAVNATVVDAETTIVIAPDGVVVVGFRDTSLTASEGETVRFVVQKVSPFDSEIDIELSGEGYNGGGRFSAGGSNRVTNLNFFYTAPENDVGLEDDVTIVINLTLLTSSPQIIMFNTVLSIVVQDNDGPVMVGFESNGVTVDENGGDIMVPVSVVQQIATNASVDVEVVSGTALEQEDYARTGLYQLEFPSNGTVFVAVGILDDGTIEPTESFTVVLSNPQPAGGVELGISVFTVTISDDDLPITIGFESIEYTVDEGGTLEVVVVKSAPFDSVIEFEVAGGSFSAVRAFPDGASSPDSISIFFQIPDDIIALEPPETISFTLTVLERNPQISVDPDTTTVTILDNDCPVTIGFDEANIIVSEDGGGDIEVAVSLLQPVAAPVSVDFNYILETAGFDDFVRTGLSRLTFTENGTQTIPLGILDDDLDELEMETFSITLFNPLPPDCVTISPDLATITIIDDDEIITVGFEAETRTVQEDGGNIFVAVTIAQEISQPVTVGIVFTDGTAIQQSDFFRTGQSELMFTTNGTLRILVGIADDAEDEPDETFSIALVNPVSGATVIVSPDTITITIIDNDEPPTGTPPPFVNTTVVGDPFFTAPVQLVGEDLGILPDTSVSLCYELHGRDGAIFSLVNDQCTLVNAHYTKALPDVDVNVIDAVYIRAKDSGGVYRKIAMSLSGGCSVTVDNVTVEREYDNDDIRIRRNTNRVRVSVPNCNKMMFVMWMICENRVLQATGNEAVDLIKFVIARGSGISESAHGLLGQMFNVPFSVRTYTGELGFLDGNERHFYMTVGNTLGGVPLTRTFVASLQPRIWDRTAGYCLYAGNRQSGPTGDVDDDDSPNDSVIEGVYTDYIVSADFATDCIYCGLYV
jgi:hypothetical protein